MLKTSESQSWPGPAYSLSSCCFMRLFSCSSMVTQPDLRSQGSQYMSRHLDRQTGPNITVGNQRSQFYRSERGSAATATFFLFPPISTRPPASVIQRYPAGLWCWCNPTWPGPDQALAACRVTSSRGLSLPLCSHLASSSSRLYFPIPLSKDPCLLASSCHAPNTSFSFDSFVVDSVFLHLLVSG